MAITPILFYINFNFPFIDAEKSQKTKASYGIQFAKLHNEKFE